MFTKKEQKCQDVVDFLHLTLPSKVLSHGFFSSVFSSSSFFFFFTPRFSFAQMLLTCMFVFRRAFSQTSVEHSGYANSRSCTSVCFVPQACSVVVCRVSRVAYNLCVCVCVRSLGDVFAHFLLQPVWSLGCWCRTMCVFLLCVSRLCFFLCIISGRFGVKSIAKMEVFPVLYLECFPVFGTYTNQMQTSELKSSLK